MQFNVDNTSLVSSDVFFKKCGFPAQQFQGSWISNEKMQLYWTSTLVISPVGLDFQHNTEKAYWISSLK